MTTIGHNSGDTTPLDTPSASAAELTQFVSRIENLEAEKKALTEDIRDVFSELKGRGFSPQALRKILAIRKQDENDRKEMQAICTLYAEALGMPEFMLL